MRGAILASLLLLVLPYIHIGEPAPVEPAVVEQEQPKVTHELRFQAMELEFQEGLARVLARKTGIPYEEALEIVEVAYQESNEHDVDIFRTLGFIVAESWAQKEAISKVGARGLMQIMPPTGKYIAAAHEEPWEGTDSLHEIDRNIRYGVWYYKYLLRTFEGDEHAAIAAYNWGPDHIAYRIRNGKALPKVYPGKVLRAQEQVQEEFWNENRDLVWRSYSRAECMLSGNGACSEPQDRTNTASLPRDISPSP